MNDKVMMAEVLTTADVAQILKLSIKTVGEMMRNGRLPAMRVGKRWRVRREALDEWMKVQEQSCVVQGKTVIGRISLEAESEKL